MSEISNVILFFQRNNGLFVLKNELAPINWQIATRDVNEKSVIAFFFHLDANKN